MPEIILGVLVLVLLFFMGQMFTGANPKTLAKGLRIAGAVLLGLAAIGAFALDRVGVGTLIASMAWGLYTGGHVLPAGLRRPHPASSQGSSEVRTAWIALTLDHATGEMRGAVLQGRSAGRRLEGMTEAELVALHGEAQSDSDTVRLLETFLDRRFGPDWRKQSQEKASRPRGSGAMTREEAYAVLGLKPGASAEEIRAAHRKLMLQNHPDRGGTDYLASKINEAKDVLLG